MIRISTVSPPLSPRPVPATLAGMTDQTFLDHLFTHGSGSRAEIARATRISKPTISDSATRLQAAGLIVEAGETAPRGRGRRAMLYRVNPDYGHSVAVILERRNLTVRVLDFCGELQFDRHCADDLNFHEGIDWAREMLAAAATVVTTPRHSATISVAAPVDPETAAVQPMAGAPLGGFVPEITADLGLAEVPLVRVDNDVNWAALAEATDPAKERGSSFLYVYLGAGIGGALVAAGHVIRGASGAAGEISFLRTPTGATLHSELSALPFGSPDHSSINVPRALEVFETPDDPIARRATGLLSQAILDAATVFDPGMVILSGPLSAADPLVDNLRRDLESRSIAPLTVTRGPSDDQLLVTGVSRQAVQDAWDAALRAVATGD